MATRISICTPIRTHHDLMFDEVRNHIAFADKPERLDFLFYFDNDDPNLAQLMLTVERLRRSIPGIEISPIVGPRIGILCAQNALAARAGGEIMIFGNDGLRFRERGWDRIIQSYIERFSDGIVVLSLMQTDGNPHTIRLNDGERQQRHGSFAVITKVLHDVLGFVFSPATSEQVCDPWLYETAFRVHRLVVPEDLHTVHIQRVTEDYIKKYEDILPYQVRYRGAWRYRVQDAERLLDHMGAFGLTSSEEIERIRGSDAFRKPRVLMQH